MKRLMIPAALALSLTACATTGDAQDAAAVKVSDCVIQEPLPGKNMTGAFMLFNNTSENDVVLKAAHADEVTSRVEIHEMVVEDNVMKMQHMHEYTLTPGEHQFKKGSYHIMLMDIAQPIQAGDVREIRFDFADGSEGKCQAEVKTVEEVNALYNIKADAKKDMHQHHHH